MRWVNGMDGACGVLRPGAALVLASRQGTEELRKRRQVAALHKSKLTIRPVLSVSTASATASFRLSFVSGTFK